MLPCYIGVPVPSKPAFNYLTSCSDEYFISHSSITPKPNTNVMRVKEISIVAPVITEMHML